MYNLFIYFLITILKAQEGECEQAVKDAIDAGYRHIDTAFYYRNEKEVGSAIRAKIDQGVVKREDLFVVTKASSYYFCNYSILINI